MRLIKRMRGMLGLDSDEDDFEKMPLYEFNFRSPDMMTEYSIVKYLHQKPTNEMQEWLKQCEGKWQYIIEMGQLWGVGFYNEADAMAFKLRWL